MCGIGRLGNHTCTRFGFGPAMSLQLSRSFHGHGDSLARTMQVLVLAWWSHERTVLASVSGLKHKRASSCTNVLGAASSVTLRRCAHPFAKQNRRYVQSCSALFPGGARRGFSRGRFWIWLKIGRFRDLGGPGGLPNHPERWGAKPPTSLDGFQSPPGPPRPRNGRCSAKFKSPLLLNDEDLGARSCGRVELQSFF